MFVTFLTLASAASSVGLVGRKLPWEPARRGVRSTRPGLLGPGLFERSARAAGLLAWEKQVLSARGFKRVGRHSECAINIDGVEVREKRPRGFK
jgi:hypothetical protein